MGERCAKRGHDVVLLDLDADRAAHEAAALSAVHGIKALGMLADVSDARSVDAAAYAVEQRFGAADLVVSNVGVQLFGPVERFTDDEWRWVLDVNVVGSARVARAFIPLLRKAGQRGKHLAFTTSSSVFDPASRLGAYQASKFAVWGLAETLRLELRADGIGVSVIFPSGMASRHLETSQSAQPDHLRRPVGEPADFEAMMASNPQMATEDMIRTPEDAADGVIDAVLAGERYVVTHGDFVEALTARHSALIHAVESRRA